MARVHLLDDELINKIAAGEVVERPASVVKELVENAIDAGAKHVKVILKDGGRQLIQVQDDGSGLHPEDAVLAVKRHTTSKLQKADDLFQVQTMGFRGEALASIASVSRFTLQTQSRALQGHRVHIEDGKQSDAPWQGSPGTTLTIADLFYNVPARRAFMKTGAAEFAACHEYMQALALSLPAVGFTLLHNEREIFSVSPALKTAGEATMRGRAAAILGNEDAARLIYVKRSDRHADVEGLIAPPGLDKSTARHCFTFVNGRWVRDKLLRFALQRGYHSHLMKGKFPVAVMYLKIDPALVDVNVHPAKAELRFQYGQDVQNAVVYAIREALREGAWAGANPPVKMVDDPPAADPVRQAAEADIPKPVQQDPLDFDLYLPQRDDETRRTVMRFDATPPRAPTAPSKMEPPRAATVRSTSTPTPVEAPRAPMLAPTVEARAASVPVRSTPTSTPDRQTSTATPAKSSADRSSASASALNPTPAQSNIELRSSFAPVKASVPSPDGQTAIPWHELQYIGPFARCFLLFEYQQQMLAIDQHAFHERVLYERLLENPDILRRSQPLLMPEVMAFSPTECQRLVQMKDALDALGIQIQGVSETEIEVIAVPSLLVNKDLSSLLAAILGGRDQAAELHHDVLATMACHAAVRAGEELPEPELKTLLREAESVDFYHNCPHGRRVFRWWKLAQVAAWFDR